MIWSTRILLIVATVSSLWLQCTQAYCIYNRLMSDGSIEIYDAAKSFGPASFYKKLPYNTAKECCAWNNPDCNSSANRLTILFFNVKFKFIQGLNNEEIFTPTFRTNCTAGGALTFFGSSPDYYGVCTEPSGAKRRVLLEPVP